MSSSECEVAWECGSASSSSEGDVVASHESSVELCVELGGAAREAVQFENQWTPRFVIIKNDRDASSIEYT